MESFIECVRVQPCLWNPLHPEYRDMVVRDQAWRTIVMQCKSTSIPNVKTARIEWRKLRDNHREALKRAKLGQNKLLPAQITTWKYAKAMQFLEPHMKYRITEDSELEAGASDVSTSEPIAPSPAPAATPPAPKLLLERRRRASDCCDSCDHSPPPLRRRTEAHALHSFFHCALQTTAQMPLYMQTQVKKNIFAVIIEAEEALARGAEPPPAPPPPKEPPHTDFKAQIQDRVKIEVTDTTYT